MPLITNSSYRKKFRCKTCGYESRVLHTVKTHFLREHLNQNLQEARDAIHCNVCGVNYQRFITHFQKKHLEVRFYCTRCHEHFNTEDRHLLHLHESHPVPNGNKYIEIESAFNRRLQTFQTILPPNVFQTLELAFNHLREDSVKLITYQLNLKHLLRYSIIFICRYVKYDEIGGISETADVNLRATNTSVFLADQNDIDNCVDKTFNELRTRHEQFLGGGSGWVLHHVMHSNLEIGKLSLAGGCSSDSYYMSTIPAVKRKYLLDCETAGEECFFNSVALGLMSNCSDLCDKQRGLLARQYTRTHFNISGLSVPLDVRDVKKFERKNKNLNIAINVFSVLDKRLVPIHKSINLNDQCSIINLLLISDRMQMTHHYILITDFNRFCNQFNDRRFYCGNCLNSFSTEEALTNHKINCSKNNVAKVKYPEPGSEEKFTSYDKQVLQPFFGVCDFEASLEPVTRIENGLKYTCVNCVNNGPESKCTHATKDIHHQVPTTYCIMIMNMKGEIIFERTESKEDNVMEEFFETLRYIEDNFFPLLQKYRYKNDYTKEELSAFKQSQRCYLCSEPFQDHINNFRKVKDHCHYSNQYLGAAHSICNWVRSVVRQIPVFIHNFKNYDAQFILQGLKFSKKKDISGLPFNMEKFRTLEVGRITFVDSMQLLPASLSELVNNLTLSGHTFPLLNQLPYFKNISIEQRALLLQKGVYPYEWASSIHKLESQTSFPPKDAFYSILTRKNISDEEYFHGLQVFQKFKCKDMLDYCHLYCQLDTVLLLEVLQEFRLMVKKDFGLDCTKYISAPQLAFDAMKLTLDEPIELMSDSEMILMCEQNVRGGVSFVNERHVQLKNYTKKPAGTNLDDKIQDQLLYIDVNNLYSVAQSAPLPHHGYAWCSEKDIEILTREILNINIDNDVGFILEVDLEYPEELHELHASLPFLPQQELFTFDDLSPFSQKSMEILQGKNRAKNYKATKLVTNLKNKKSYVIHYRMLQTCLRAGLKLKKIRRGIKFYQSRYLKIFIDLCTNKRKNAKSPFIKMLMKLFMNSVYGKFLQNNRAHFEVKICTKQTLFKKYFSAVNYKGHRMLSTNVVAVFLSLV